MPEDAPLQNVTPFQWTKPRRDAAQLLAQDELTDEEISTQVGVSRQTLYRWKTHPEFQAYYEQQVKELADVTRRHAVAKKARRVRYLNERVNLMHRVIEERAADPDMQGVPGGTTGILVRTLKSVGGGDRAQIVEEYEVDTGLLRELREHEKQAAVEVGQWTEKRDHTFPNIDELIARELARLTGTGQGTTAGTPAADTDPGQS